MANQKNTDSNKAKNLQFVGRWIITPLYAIGSGVLTVVAVSMLSFIAPLALPYLIPLLIFAFLSETIVSIYFFKDSVPDTLKNLFVNDIFKDLSTTKKILLGLGIFAAFGAGMAVGSTTFMSTLTVTAAILGLFSLTCTPLGYVFAIILGFAGFISIVGLFTKPIIYCIQNDAHKQIGQFFINLITRDPKKFLAQQILEGIFKVLFTTAFISIAIIGTIATLGTMRLGLSKFLTLIPRANLLAVRISSGIIAFGLMGTARLPWVIHSLGNLSSQLGELAGALVFKMGYKIAIRTHAYNPPISDNEITNETPLDSETMIDSTMKISFVLCHAFSFASLAKQGGGAVLADLLKELIKLGLPIPDSKADLIGQISSFISGGVMAGGLSAYAMLFSKSSKPAASEEQPASVEKAEGKDPLILASIP